jgi:hypothetical protein
MGGIGDVFSGFGPHVLQDLNQSLFSTAGKNDPFSAGADQSVIEYYDATFASAVDYISSTGIADTYDSYASAPSKSRIKTQTRKARGHHDSSGVISDDYFTSSGGDFFTSSGVDYLTSSPGTPLNTYAWNETVNTSSDVFSAGSTDFSERQELPGQPNGTITTLDANFPSGVKNTDFANRPQLWGATNGTIGPQRFNLPSASGRKRRRIALAKVPGLQLWGATNDTLVPASASLSTGKKSNGASAPRWDDSRLPLRVYVSGTVESARSGLIRSEIKNAFADWYQASDGKIKYVITNRFSEADIYFVCQQTADGEWADNVTEFHNGMLDRVKVCFIQSALYDLDPKRVKALCLHEIGHALGILKESSNQKDAMSLSATDDFHPIVRLTGGDRRLISTLYGK